MKQVYPFVNTDDNRRQQMRKTFLTLVAGLAMTAMLPAPVANATLYIFSFVSFDGALTASGQMTVDSSNDVVAIAGTVFGLVDETISGVVADPGFPGAATSPDGSFVFDNLSAEGAEPALGPAPPEALARRMHAAWLAFARDGDPGWQAYDKTCPVMIFDEPGGGVEADPRGDERRMWLPGPAGGAHG